MSKSTAPPDPIGEAERKSARKLRRKFYQGLLNLQVWYPLIRDPDFENRTVIFPDEPFLDGKTWTVATPRVCWHCGADEQLEEHAFKRSRRGFGYHAVALIPCLAVLWIVSSILLVVQISYLFLFQLGLPIAAVVYYFLGSSVYTIKLKMFACPYHEDEVRCPQMTVHADSLYTIFNNVYLSRATRADVASQIEKLNEYVEQAPTRAPAGPLKVKLDQPQEKPGKSAELDPGPRPTKPQTERPRPGSIPIELDLDEEQER